MKKIFWLAIILCSTLKAGETNYYDSNGRFAGREVNNSYYDANGRYMGREVNGRFYDSVGRYAGTIRASGNIQGPNTGSTIYKNNSAKTTPTKPGSKPFNFSPKVGKK